VDLATREDLRFITVEVGVLFVMTISTIVMPRWLVTCSALGMFVQKLFYFTACKRK